ncbi:MAG: DUF5317 domain-containing protein [Anaerolineae bacterium]
MILVLALILALFVAVLTGGKLRRLANLPLRAPWLALLGFGLQIYIIYEPETTARGWLSPHTLVLVLSYVLLLVFVWMNRRLPGMPIIALGLLMNFTVMLANGGYMPISPEAVQRVGHEYELQSTAPGARLKYTKDILLPREQTRLWFLADVFILPPPFPIPTVFSPGDTVLALGIWMLILAVCHSSRWGHPPAQAR